MFFCIGIAIGFVEGMMFSQVIETVKDYFLCFGFLSDLHYKVNYSKKE